MKTQDLLAEAVSLPIEERAFLVDRLLSSLNTPQSDLDRQWVSVAKERLHQLKSGQVEPIAYEDVLKKIGAKFR